MAKASVAGAAADNEAMVQWLFENSHDLMFVSDLDGRVVLVNDAWTRATGWTDGEIVGRKILGLVHPDDSEAAGAFFGQLVDGEAAEHSARFLMKDGSWRRYDGRGQVTTDGRLFGVLCEAGDLRTRAVQLRRERLAQTQLSEAAGIGGWTYDLAKQQLTVSDNILAELGYSAAETQSAEQLAELLHPDDRAGMLAIIAPGAGLAAPQTHEHRLRNKAGDYTTWRVTFLKEALLDGGTVVRGMSQNVTELAQARDAALGAEQQSRQFVECAPFAVAMFDRDLRYLVVSPRWLHGFGLAGRDHIGSRLQDIFPDIPKRFVAAQKRALAGEVVSRSEDRFTDSRGGEHWIRWEARPWRDADGQIGGVLAYADDISALARSRMDLQANSRRLEMALVAAEAGVYEIDHVNRTFWASPEFHRLVGGGQGSYDDFLHLSYPQFHPDDLEQVREIFGAINRGERQSGEAFETRIILAGGEERWVRVFHHLDIDRDGRPLKGVGLVLDFDVRKRQELALIEAQRVAESAGEAKASFLANMSHEIRTPMNGVMGVLHLLKNEDLSDDGRNMLEEALSCGHMLAELLNDVIDFSKIEAGHLQISTEPLDPRALVDGVVRLLGSQAEAKGLFLTADTDEDLGWVNADPVRLRQAMFNLVGNAVKFTLQGGVTIRCRRRDSAEGPMLRFEVQDSGVGVPVEVQPRIFQRFNQGDASTTRRFGGSGLGLAITRKLAEMMGGSVGFTSVEGEGSTFWLEIAAASAETPQLVTDPGEGCLDGLRVLVVEDNSTNRMIATKLLENLGAMVETAADGLLGVEAATRNSFDLILMDVQMPGIDGLEASRRIRKLDGLIAQTPIVALTANVLSHQRESYFEAGMNGVVGKPISPAALLAEIARLGAQTLAPSASRASAA